MDSTLRTNQRISSTNPGDVEARIKEIRSLMRAGKLTDYNVEIAAYCLDDAAWSICEYDNPEACDHIPGICRCGSCNLSNEGFLRWLDGLAIWGECSDDYRYSLENSSNPINNVMLCAEIAAARVAHSQLASCIQQKIITNTSWSVDDTRNIWSVDTRDILSNLIPAINAVINMAENWLKHPCPNCFDKWQRVTDSWDQILDLLNNPAITADFIWIPRTNHYDVEQDGVGSSVPYHRIIRTIGFVGKEKIQDACLEACARWALTPKELH